MFAFPSHPRRERRHDERPRHERCHHHEDHAGPGGHPFPMPGRGRFGRSAVRRGEIRHLVLGCLAERPMHGYEVISELETQSGGRWRPSAGSVYPTLQQLADEGLVTGEEVEGRRTYALTEGGRAAAAASPGRPWGRRDWGSEGNLRRLGLELVGAATQVQRAGSVQAREEAARILADARRALYRLLADDVSAPVEGQAARAAEATDDASGSQRA